MRSQRHTARFNAFLPRSIRQCHRSADKWRGIYVG